MSRISWERRPSASDRRRLVAWAVFLGVCQAAIPARGDAKPIKPADPPSQPSPTAPTLSTPTMGFVYVRSFADNKGTTPITAVMAAGGAKISVVPFPASITDPGALADITLTSTFFGRKFTYIFTNIPLDKDNNFTVDSTNSSAALATQFSGLYTLLQNAINAKQPVNPDPRTPIVWSDPVKVQLTLVAPDKALETAVTTAQAADNTAQTAVDALNKPSADADAAVDAANKAIAAAKTPAETAAAKQVLDKANQIKAGIDAAKGAVAKVKTDTAAALAKALAAKQAGTLIPYSPAPNPDTRWKNPSTNPPFTTTDLTLQLQEGP